MKIKEKPKVIRLVAAVLSLLMISSVLPFFAVTASAAITPSTPNKDSNGVYQIGTTEELYGFAQLVNSKTEPSASAVLTKDIVVNKGVLKDDGTLNSGTFTGWTPIGTDYDHTYTGTFDGQNHTISGLYFNDTSTSSAGLFGYLGSGGEIKNVGVIDSYIRGYTYVGGICGENRSGTITGCYNTGTVSGSRRYVGGVCGYNWNTVTGSYNTGKVSGSSYVGGVCGYNSRYGTTTGCYNTGTVSGTGSTSQYIGGVCGFNGFGGTITGSYTNNGGVCGLNNGTVKDCDIKSDTEFADGTVCGLLNVALKNYGSDVRYYQGANYPEPVANVPDLVEGVYQISNKLELYAFAKIVNRFEPSANAVLTADIVVNTGVLKTDGNLADDVSSFTSWTPIGYWNSSSDNVYYSGTFDGQGHTISGLYFNNLSTSYVGLFGYLGSGGEIKNVGVIDSYISGSDTVGGICGENNSGTITGCYNTGAVSSSGYYVGGVCAVNKGGKIIGCYNTGTVSGVNGVGGVCAVNNSTITGCYNTGEVIGTTYVGGVCGFNSGTITGCYINKGGVCGYNFRGTVTDSDVKTDAEFANGTVCKLLNTALKNASSKVLFCQTIGTDALPLLDYQIEEHTPLYTVENKTFKVTCLCGKKSKTMELTLKTDKTVVVNGAENTLTATLSNLENEAVTYKWYQNGVEIQGETSATYQMPTDLAAGTYTYKVEVTMENVGTITQSVDVLVDITPQYYVNIPATVNIGDNFTVGASGVLLKNNAKLNVSLLSDFTLSTAKGASLNYEILTSNSKLTSGDTLLTVQGSQDPKAPGSGTSETYNVALALGETPTHSGNYTDTLTFTIKVEP